ncbi:MAG: hypothetical protein IKM24_05230 [Clostridia bacterium]|nr:hypothetical protein [Clostridia bacterium]
MIAVVLFFWLGIPSVIGDLSGRTAKKAIQKARQSNESSGSKSFRPSEANAARGKLTSTMQHERRNDGKTVKTAQQPSQAKKETAKKAKQKKETASRKAVSLADEMVETGLLSTAKAQFVGEETEIIVMQDVKWEQEGTQTERLERGEKIRLTLVEEIMLIHTSEVIG